MGSTLQIVGSLLQLNELNEGIRMQNIKHLHRIGELSCIIRLDSLGAPTLEISYSLNHKELVLINFDAN